MADGLVLVHLVCLAFYSFTLYHAFLMEIPLLADIYKKFDPGQLKLLTNSREMREGLAIGFHVVAFPLFAFAVYYDFMYTVVPHNITKMHSAFGGKFKFLTFWDAILQTIFFFICILNDCFGTNAANIKKPSFIRKLKDHVHATLGFPIAMFVGLTFWALMFVDRELVLPKALDPYFPWWLNHLMHTMIMVTTLSEMIFVPRQYPKRSRGLGILVSFMLTYLVWVHVIYFKSGVWVYPVMDVLILPLRIVFFVVLISFCIILYFAGEALNNFLWGKKYVAVAEEADADMKTGTVDGQEES